MTSPRKQPSGAFWTTVALVAVLVAYPLSFGPACWVCSRTNSGGAIVSAVYRPLSWGMVQSNGIFSALDWYSGLWAADGWAWLLIPGADKLNWKEGDASPIPTPAS